MESESTQPKQDDSTDQAFLSVRPRLRRAVEVVRRWGPTMYTAGRIIWSVIKEVS